MVDYTEAIENSFRADPVGSPLFHNITFRNYCPLPLTNHYKPVSCCQIPLGWCYYREDANVNISHGGLCLPPACMHPYIACTLTSLYSAALTILLQRAHLEHHSIVICTLLLYHVVTRHVACAIIVTWHYADNISIVPITILQ